MHNVGLMNVIQCLAARYLSLQPSTGPFLSESQLATQNDAIQYYHKTLHCIQNAMQYDTYKTSLELLSTSLIASTYGMLGGSSENWERHLKGVFWIQRSQTMVTPEACDKAFGGRGCAKMCGRPSEKSAVRSHSRSQSKH